MQSGLHKCLHMEVDGGTYLVIIKELITSGNCTFGIDYNVLLAFYSDDLGVTVWVAAVINEPCNAALRRIMQSSAHCTTSAQHLQ